MSNLSEGLLEKGYWEPAKQVTKIPVFARASQWAVDILRPAVFTKPSGRDAPVRRTAYLDGLRGFAAFLVYWGHHELWAHELNHAELVFENAYGYEGRYYFAALPGLRVLFCGGHFAVTVFFVLSGYVLSAKPLSLIQSGDYLKLGDNLSSALFRRWLRLYIPVIVTTFLYMLAFRFFWTAAVPRPAGNLRDELWNYYVEFKNFSFVFRTGGEPWFTYNFHSWSIPVEFKGSIIIYTALLAFSRCTRNARLMGEVTLIVYFMWIVDGWFGALFMSGMLLCDLDLLAADDNLPSFFKRLEPYKKQFFYTLLVCGIYLGGCPAQNPDIDVLRRSPGWMWLAKLKPQAVWDYKWFYLLFASTFTVSAISRIHWLKSFFETRFCLYLGRISFALYLVHGPVIWTLGERVYAAVGFTRESNVHCATAWINILKLPKVGPVGLEPSFLLCQLILLPVTFWLAELVTKLVDEPSVKFAQWLYGKTLAPAIKL